MKARKFRGKGKLGVWAVLAGVVLALPSSARAEDIWTDRFPGVRHLNRRTGNQNIHAVVVDLCAPGIAIRASAQGEGKRTTSNFGAGVGAQVAINGDFNIGSGTDGPAAHEGVFWGGSDHGYVAPLAFGEGRSNLAPHEQTNGIESWMREVVSGHPTLMVNGNIRSEAFNGDTALCGGIRHPRTAVGLSADHRKLVLIVADGRTSTRIGLTCDETAALLTELGASDAVNFDGGGSSTMWMQGIGVLNNPSDGSQRYLANHLGVYASGSGPARHCPAPPPPPPPPPCNAEAGIFSWSCSGAVANKVCTQITEPSDPDSWTDNFFCSDFDIGARWSSVGAIAGMRCTSVNEASEPPEHFWGDNYFCVPNDSPFTFQWSSPEPIAGQTCLPWKESSDPHTWNDNYLCWTERCDARVGPLAFNCAGQVPNMVCTSVNEPSDPHAWSDNYLCSEQNIGLRWSSVGAIEGMRCTAITEAAEPPEHFWNDNYVCVPPDSPYQFKWSSAGPLGGFSCLPWREPGDPDTWRDNYLCWPPLPGDPPPGVVTPATNTPEPGNPEVVSPPASSEPGPFVRKTTVAEGVGCNAIPMAPLGLVLASLLGITGVRRRRRQRRRP